MTETTMTMTIKKYRCTKCGRIVQRRRGTTCPLLEIVPAGLFRKPTYRCGGTLTRVVKPARTRHVDLESKLHAAERNLARSLSRLRRASTSVKTWQRRIARLEKLVAAAKLIAVPAPGHTSLRTTRAIDLSD